MTTSTLASPPAASGGGGKELTVTVGDLVPLDGTEDELVLLAAAAAPIGSTDPADRALLQTAVAMQDLRHLVQLSVTPATPATRFSDATVRYPAGDRTFRVLRGELNAVLAALPPNSVVADAAHAAAARITRGGFRPLAVAVVPALAPAPVSSAPAYPAPAAPADASARLVGLIPLKATLVKPHFSDAATDWVYVKLWDPALRFMHWIAVACILLLIGTGYMIATPFLAPGTAAAQPYLMGYIRLVHFIAAGLLIATAVVRIADLFFSPYPYARWRALWPINNRAEASATLDVLKGYLFFRTHRNPTWVGLNPLQAVTYTGVYGLALLMVVTGLALFGLYNPNQWPYSWFQWLNNWLGSDMVRTIHYIGMWLFLVFIPAHIYLSVRSDTVDRGGAISSMFNGGVWVRKSAPVVDADHYRDATK